MFSLKKYYNNNGFLESPFFEKLVNSFSSLIVCFLIEYGIPHRLINRGVVIKIGIIFEGVLKWHITMAVLNE